MSYDLTLADGMPQKTIAAILVEQRQDLVIAEIDLPKALGIGQVLVEVLYSGICGSQLGEIDGAKGPDPWLPHLLGHEASGRVLAVGPGVSHFHPGDEVVLHWRIAQGIEAKPAKYDWHGKVVNAGWVTTFNQFTVVSENRITKLPQGSDLKTAALYGCAITTGFGTIDHIAKLRLGESVIVFGAGGIGLNLIQAAQLAGAQAIVAVDRFASRLGLARACGASHIICSESVDPWDALREVFYKDSPNGSAPDVFIDNTGHPEVIAKGYELVANQGRVVLVGVPKKGANISIYSLPLHFGKSILGTTGGEARPDADIPRYMRLARSRGLDFRSIITETGTIDQVNDLIAAMRSGRSAGRCVIKF